MNYLKLPLDLSGALNGQIQRCSYEESIAQHLMMLVVSRHGEVEGREDYGSIMMGLGVQSSFEKTKTGKIR